jgi:hypothetical protein
VVLITTTDCSGPRRVEFERLLASLKRQRESAGRLRAYFLLQRCDSATMEEVRHCAPEGSVLVCSSTRLSLSAARNQLLEIALSDAAVGANDIVAFPDDDAWYPDDLLALLTETFRAQPDLDLLICGSSPEPEAAPIDFSSLAPASTMQVVRKISSNSMFFRGDLLSRIGAFDSGIGVGTVRPGGEDIDYALRGFLQARFAGIIDRPLVGHPLWDKTSVAKYFEGSLIALGRHARCRPSLAREFVRKVLVGLYLAGGGKMPWHAYLTALREAMRQIAGQRPRQTTGLDRA